MARIRQVKPCLFRHEHLFELEKHCALPVRISFIGLWTACDRDGRFRWRPRELKLDVLPYDEVDFEAVLIALESKGFVISYIVSGEKYGYIPSWDKHQNPHVKEQSSTIPAPCKPDATPVLSTDKPSLSTADSGERILGNGLRNTDSGDTPDSLMQAVATELRVTDRWQKVSCSEQIKLAMLAGEPGKAIAERMIESGHKYRAGPDFKFGGWKKFFADGLWSQNGTESQYDRVIAEANKQLADN